MKYLFFLTSLLLSSSCSNTDDNTSSCNGAVCTFDFRTITVEIKDSSDNPVALDVFKVTNVKTGDDLTLEIFENQWEIMRKNGSYPIFSDRYSNEFRNKTLKINFKGFINDKEVISSDFIVGADCCHVSLIEGENSITIN